MSFKYISYQELWWPFFRQSGTKCVIMLEGIMKHSFNYFEYKPMVQEEMPFKDFSYLQLWRPFCLAEQNHLCKFGRGHHEEHFFEIILHLDQWFRRCHLKRELI